MQSEPRDPPAALVGHYRDEHVFALRQALELYDAYQRCLADTDGEIERALARLHADVPPPATPLPAPRLKARRAKDPTFDVRAALHALLGVDLTQIHGLGPSVALTLVGECGTDMSRWPTAKHFTSWLALAPRNKVSGGKVLSSTTRRSANRAAVGLRLARSPWGRPIPPWVPSIVVSGRGPARPRPSPPPHANSRSCSTTRCAMAWSTPTPGRRTMKRDIASGRSPTYVVEPSPSASSWRKPLLQAWEFLRRSSKTHISVRSGPSRASSAKRGEVRSLMLPGTTPQRS